MPAAWHGLTGARAARAAGCSRAAFAVRLHRARARLTAELAALEAPAARGLEPQSMEVGADEPGPDVVEQAAAAVTREGAVYHVLERYEFSATGFPDAGRRTLYLEHWHTTGGRFHVKTFAARGQRRGRLLQDKAGRRLAGRRGGPALLWISGPDRIVAMGVAERDASSGAPGIDRFADPGARPRALDEQGRLRLAGTVRAARRVRAT